MLDQPYDLLRLLTMRLPSPEALEAHRLRRLRGLLRYAHRNVPYYRELFRAAGLRPDDIRRDADLRALAASSRERLREAGPDRSSRAVGPGRCNTMYSSGSTGQPWPVYRTPLEERLRRIVELRTMVAAGIRASDRIATLGPVVENDRTTLGRLGMFRTRYISPLLPVDKQAARLRALRPDVFWVYPTVLRALLQHYGRLGEIIAPRMVVTSAEPLDEPTRQRLLAEEGVELRNFYGSVEVGRIAWECPAREGLHVNTDCCIVELEDGEAVPGAGRPVVITNLNSWASPYIRYRLGDRCEMIDRPCSCGSPLPLMKAPVSREWDVIRLPSGRLMSPWGFNSMLRSEPGLLQFRLIQERVDRLRLQLMFSPSPGADRLDRLRERLATLLEQRMTLHLEIVDGFSDEALKFRAFVSELPA